jgi:putative DNA primase/helicase
MKDHLKTRAGWWKDTPAGRIYLFTEKGLRETNPGLSLEKILAALTAAGVLLETDPGRKYKRTLCPDGIVRPLYYVDWRKLQSGTGGDR